MKISGNWFMDAAPNKIVAALTDPVSLAACIPKCHDMSGTRADGFTFEFRHKIGPVAITLPGRITLTERTPNASYDVAFSGSSMLTGTVSAEARLSLTPERGGTSVGYDVASEPSRLVGLIGAERIRSMMNMAVDVFLERLSHRVEA